MKYRNPRIVIVTDGNGREYQCNEDQKVFDCARCRKLVTRRVDQNHRDGPWVLALGGHLFDYFGNNRPYCNQCYLIERGIIR